MKTPVEHDSTVLAPDQFWDVLATTQDYDIKVPQLHWYEQYLLDTAAKALAARFEQVHLIHVGGCGTGRELTPIMRAFPEARIIASDISSAMLEICQANLEKWG